MRIRNPNQSWTNWYICFFILCVVMLAVLTIINMAVNE